MFAFFFYEHNPIEIVTLLLYVNQWNWTCTKFQIYSS